MLPVISTRQLSNFELALSKDGYRVGVHRCSNLLDYDEVPTDYGFITEETKNPNVVGDTFAYQYSPELRGEETLRFYRNLNLEACLWEFNAYYEMSELLDECGGLVGTDGQVRWLTFWRVTLDPRRKVDWIDVVWAKDLKWLMKWRMRISQVYEVNIESIQFLEPILMQNIDLYLVFYSPWSLVIAYKEVKVVSSTNLSVFDACFRFIDGETIMF